MQHGESLLPCYQKPRVLSISAKLHNELTIGVCSSYITAVRTVHSSALARGGLRCRTELSTLRTRALTTAMLRKSERCALRMVAAFRCARTLLNGIAFEVSLREGYSHLGAAS
jgi:hypothetical protein